MAYKIGIDFGTTNTVISYIKDGIPEVFKYPANDPSYYIPSVVSKDKKYIGVQAWDEIYVSAMKMFLPLSNEELSQNNWNGEYAPEEYIQTFFEKLLKKEHNDSFESTIGEISDIILCVPQVWSNDVSHLGREKMKKIFTRLGYNVSRIVSEPIAAAAYFVNWHKVKFQNDFSGNLLVCDMGGGTFDVTLCRVDSSGKIESIKNEGNGTTITGKGFAGVYFDETLIKNSFRRIHNTEISEDEFMPLYINLQTIKVRTTTKVKGYFTVAETQRSQEDRDKTEIYRAHPLVFTYQDVVSSFEKIGDEIGNVLKKVYSPGMNINAYFLTGGFNQFYLCSKEIIGFFDDIQSEAKKYDASVDSSIAGKSISFGASLIANGLVNIDEKFPHSFGVISYRMNRNEHGSIEGLSKEYTRLIEGGKNLNNYLDYSYSKQTYSIADPKKFKGEFYVDINGDESQRLEFTFKNFTIPNPNIPGNKWSVGLKIDLSQIVHVVFKDSHGDITEHQLNDILKFQDKLISE